MLPVPVDIPEFYENLDLDHICTPVKWQVFENFLKEANYDAKETTFLVQGFKEGFDLGYQGPTNRQSRAHNLPFHIGNRVQLWNKLMKEVKLKRVTGPFDEIPFDNYIQSPIGLVPKAGGDQTRLIFYLYYDFGESVSCKSVNSLTPKVLCSVKYNDLDHAVRTYLNLWESEDDCTEVDDEQAQGLHNKLGEADCVADTPTDQQERRGRFAEFRPRIIFAGKTDVKSAFRVAPLKKSCWQWLVMQAENPVTKKIQFFVDKCLPFSVSISCSYFQ